MSRVTIYSLDYSFTNLVPVCCSMSASNCCFLICIHISQEAGQVVWYSYLFKIVVIHRVKGFGIVSKGETDLFLEFSCFFYDLMDVGNLISGSSAFSKTSLNIRKFTVHVFLKPGLENFEHNFTSMWDECIVQRFELSVALPFFGIGMKTDFSSPVATAEFSKFAGILSAALSQHHLSGFEIAQLEFHHLH